ncbi:hypothetical protein C2G38_2141311 [Gigaspora rosea]|uniref:Uncharacterized protein n=1 Tax=Gigaspora rosea TaxID=44941 RepID=A0A397VEB8_9GLOM|nr:hypothetical protein C2G38_2141311 [Gigaspora rosea]
MDLMAKLAMSLVLIVQSDALIYKTKPRPRKNKSIFTPTWPTWPNKPVKTATTSTPNEGAKACNWSCPPGRVCPAVCHSRPTENKSILTTTRPNEPVKTVTTSTPNEGAKACNWSCPPGMACAAVCHYD